MRFAQQLVCSKLIAWIIVLVLLFAHSSVAELIPVRHVEGVTLGFLVLRNLDGEAVGYGELKQVTKGDLVTDDLHFRFKDGSEYQEITKFTQQKEFHLVSDQVLQKGPSFKQESESWIDADSGKITVRTVDKGKEKRTTKHLDLPPDVCNGLLFTLTKNIDPSAAQTTVPMVAASDKPRLIQLNITPSEEKTVKIGLLTEKAQQYVVKAKIGGIAGVVAPLLGKQPPDIHIWIIKSQAPTFLEFEGPLSQDSPVWRIELTAPQPDVAKTKQNRSE